MLMHPEAQKKEEQCADALEKWCEQERLLNAQGEEYRLSAAFKVTALRLLMNAKKEQFEMMENEARSRAGDKVSDEVFAYLLNRVREYATKRR